MAGRDVHRLGTVLGRPFSHLQPFRQRHALGEQVVGAEPEDHREVGHLGPDPAQDVEPEPGPILQ
jgi:hypothetical protein